VSVTGRLSALPLSQRSSFRVVDAALPLNRARH